eukprot:149074-Pleurochrysis_carterae.AAC.1
MTPEDWQLSLEALTSTQYSFEWDQIHLALLLQCSHVQQLPLCRVSLRRDHALHERNRLIVCFASSAASRSRCFACRTLSVTSLSRSRSGPCRLNGSEQQQLH